MKQDQILLALVASNDASTWVKDMYGWKESRDQVIDVCDWTGVDCGWEVGTVHSINLSGTNLATTIPSELGLLSELKTLDLSNNLIIGTIPAEVAALPNLEEFILLNNNLSGSLPEFVSKKLRKLDLENNNLSGKIPSDIGYNHQDMNYFSLCTNSFSGTIPSSLGQMTKLETLGLSENQLYGSIPSELGDLSLLRYLYVDNNDLMGLVPSELFTESSRLTEVWLHHNHFSGTIPPEMAELPELTDFFIDRCKFTGTVPPDMCEDVNIDFISETGLRRLTDEEYDVCDDVACPQNTWSVEGVYPCEPCPAGTVNPYLGRTSGCFENDDDEILHDLFNAFGGITKNWNNWFLQNYTTCQFFGVTCNDQGRVTRIELPSKGLVGTIPESLGFMEHLEVLNLADNDLVGFLPPDLVHAPLKQLDITGNKLIGIVPPHLCMKNVNQNGHDGRYECDHVACPQGTYSSTGKNDGATCLPCNDGVDYIGKKYCMPGFSASSYGSSDQVKTPAQKFGIVLGVAGGIMVIAGVIIYLKPKFLSNGHEPVNNSDIADFSSDLHDSFDGSQVMTIDEYSPNIRDDISLS